MRDKRGVLLAVGLMSVSALTGCGSRTIRRPRTAGPSQSRLGASPPVSPTPSPTRHEEEKAQAQAVPAGQPERARRDPAAARAVDTSHPTRVVGKGTPGSCTSRAVVSAVAAGGLIRFSCGAKPVTITDAGHREGQERQRPARRPGRRRQGHAQRRRTAPDPLHEHLRQGAGLDHLALPGPVDAAAHRAEPHVRRRQLHRRPDRGRRRRRHLRPRRPVQGGQLPVRPQPLRPLSGPTSAAPRSACSASRTTCPSTS